MYQNKTIKTRIKTILSKNNFDENTAEKGADILTDCAETLFKKNVNDIDGFVKMAFGVVNGSLDFDEYETKKSDYVIRKQRVMSQETINARFEKAYKKLCEKYGKGE